MEGVGWIFLIDLNTDYIVAENELVKYVVKKVGKGLRLRNFAKSQFYGAHPRRGESIEQKCDFF